MTPVHVVKEYLAAFELKDHETARSWLSNENFHFKSSLHEFWKAEDFIEHLSMLDPVLDHVDIRKIFWDGNDVIVVFDFVTNSENLGTTQLSVWYKVNDNFKITSTEAFFDARKWESYFNSEGFEYRKSA